MASECWLWFGAFDKDGYGCKTVHVDNNTRETTKRAHRMSYEAFVGKIPEDMVIDHLCRNRACVNPTHLEIVTTRENVLRSEISRAGRNSRKTRCKHGHKFDEKNTYFRPKSDGKIWRMCRACRTIRERSRIHGIREN